MGIPPNPNFPYTPPMPAAATHRAGRNPIASAINPPSGAPMTTTPRFIERIVVFIRACNRSGVTICR